MPILSIVIANFNYGRYLGDAIRSVLDQGCDGVELIVVDGGSTDESVDVIRQYANRIAWWCTEKDKGQSDAFNKGFAHATGKYLTWLNADDVYFPGALHKILHELRTHPGCEWFTGNFLRFTNDGRVVEIGYGPHAYPEWLQRHNSPLVIFGPTTFFTKRALEDIGGINVDYRYAMDTDLWLRFQTSRVKQRRINALCWAFRMHEKSKTAEYDAHQLDPAIRRRLHDEVMKSYALCEYRPSRVLHVLILFLRIFDGSFLKRMWLQRTLRHFAVKGNKELK